MASIYQSFSIQRYKVYIIIQLIYSVRVYIQKNQNTTSEANTVLLHVNL